MSDNNDDKNIMLFFLAGVGVGALIGAAAGLLLAPKPGAETRAELGQKVEELRSKVGDWVKERRQKAGVSREHLSDEVGA